MASGWAPTRIELRGFGGVGERRLALELGPPLVVLEGPNGSGKSTLVSAIEWALFGELVFPSDLDVSELKGSGSGPRLVYINRTCPEAEVRVRFERAGSVLEWSRSRRRSDPRKDTVEAVRDGVAVEADPLALFGIDHELYARAVAPRQGSLAALVSLESKERNAALDRLFGIEQLNVLAQGLGKAKGALTRQTAELERRFEALETSRRREVAWRFDRRAEARAAALAAGLTQAELGLDAARTRAHRLAGELRVTPSAANPTLAELRELQRQLTDAADRAWARPSAQRRLERLQRVEAALTTGPVSRLATARAARDEAAAARDELIARTGPAAAIEQRLREAEEQLAAVERTLAAAGGRERVLVAARDWLARHEHDGEDVCPVCERPIGLEELGQLVAAGLAQAGEAVASLAEQRERAEAAREAAGRDRKALADAERELSARSAAVDSVLGEAARSLAALADELERAEAKEVEQPLVVSLRAASARCADGAPENELATAFSELETACARALEATRHEVEQAVSRARATHEDVSALGKLLDFLEADEALARLDTSLASDELAKGRAGLQGALHAAEVVKAVAEHVGEIALAEAKARTEAVAPRLEQWFSQLTAHDQLRAARLRVEVTRAGGRIRNVYRVRAASADGSWEAAPGPMLSGGYQTALAVAALCALADPGVRGHGLDLLVLDEPTQNLDPELTELLAAAIVHAAPAGRTIVTTADGLFTQALERVAGGEAASVVRLGRWAEATGVAVLP